ncbi:type III secretion protein, HrcV family [Citrobacter youngae ATCC 29220]|uniref:Type III secretion protein, HrcV family n=2 Tax=Citrobacter youngae TaxID=133448 RepID=D4BKG5_9ENTR|nr:type III secretion system export apparatus subunit SctV [Citrobacter youngae]EFE05596.1 type III secretion protein, HrcV family [Citrobacter youngae ATCC 29220]
MKSITLSGLEKIGKYQGAILAIILVLAVFMMILPLPTAIVDILIAFNLMFSLVLLMVVVYLNSAVEFSVFPSLLLITTLYRLSLTVSTSRLILLQHDAGDIVYAFGKFVVGGNLTVGLIIFSIITIVQFIVITKGSERVAEVSARFSLDGMPGKQMSIDGDLRAGSITTEQAAMRREMVQHESKLYGSMDGAMKFVKGDAIASIIVILVNIFGGMAIGIMHEGMSASEALSTYSILSVGDGLVAQIPALLISITAGVLVTRVPGVSGKTNLASELFNQLGNRSMPLIISSGVLIIFSLIPGFPATVFLPMALVIGIIAYLLYRRGDNNSEDYGACKNSKDDISLSPGVEPLLVKITQDIDESALVTALESLRWSFFERFGIALGTIKIEKLSDNDASDISSIIFCIYHEQVAKLELNSACLYLLKPGLVVEDAPSGLTKKSLLPGFDLIWLDEAAKNRVLEQGFSVYEIPRAIACCMEHILERHAKEFIGVQETRYLMDSMEINYAELVKELQRQVQLNRVTDVLQRLVEEGISIRDLRTIFETLIIWAAKEKDLVTLTEYVRVALKRQIVNRHLHGGPSKMWIIGTNIEGLIRESIRQTVAGAYSAMEPEVNQKILAQIGLELGRHTQGVLLTAIDVRRYLRKIIEVEHYAFSVLSFMEVSNMESFDVMGGIDLIGDAN